MIKKPCNETQRVFNEMYKSGGFSDPTDLLQLLKTHGKLVNADAINQTTTVLSTLKEFNPWHVSFALGVIWGNLTKFDIDFIEAFAILMEHWDDDNLNHAMNFHFDKGAKSMTKLMESAYRMFSNVKLPEKLPSTLDGLFEAQQRWFTPVLKENLGLTYFGEWNATAMFKVALLAQPNLAISQKYPKPLLPSTGSVRSGLRILHKAGIVTSIVSSIDETESKFDTKRLMEANYILAELCEYFNDWGLIDVHTGVYMLGTNDLNSDKALKLP